MGGADGGCFFGRLVVLLPAFCLGGAYVGTALGESAFRFANFHLANRAWLSFWLTPITRATPAFRADVAERPRSQVHFIVVLASGRPPDPYAALTPAQRCAIESALMVSSTVTLWVASDVALEHTRPQWAHFRASLLRPP